jgi:DNA polymerase III subunit beta
MTVGAAETFVDTMLAEDLKPAVAATPERTFAIEIKCFILRLLIDRAARVVPTRESMPVLKNLRFDARDSRLNVTATDTELTLVTATELVEISQPGTAYFPAKRLAEIVRTAEGDSATITATGFTATITIGRTTWQIKLATGADWPPEPATGAAEHHTIDRVSFVTALNTVRYAAARDARTSLMMIDIRAGRMTACDGVRLQQVLVPELTVECQLPVGAVDDLVRLLGESEQKVFGLAVTANTLVFTIGVDTFIVRRLTAKPPDVEAQILRPAASNDQRLTVDRAALVSAVKRVRINADHTTSAIVLTLNPASGEQPANIAVSTCDTNANAASETIEADWRGPTRTVVVHHVFLLDALAVQKQPTVSLNLGPDSRTRPSALLLADESNSGVIPQMRADWVSQ